MLEPGHTILDPSRVAAQVVSGIGFIGGGLIFVQRSNVRGLTTAAGVWSTAGVGLACGGNLPILAAAMTFAYLLVSVGYPYVTSRLPASLDMTSPVLVTYVDGAGVLRRLMAEAAASGFSIADLVVEREAHQKDGSGKKQRTVTVRLALRGRGSVAHLSAELEALDGVLRVRAADVNVKSASEH